MQFTWRNYFIYIYIYIYIIQFENFWKLYYRILEILILKFFKYGFQIKFIHLSNFTEILKKFYNYTIEF